MQTSSPIDANIWAFVVQFDGCIDWPTARDLAKLKDARKPWTVIFSDVETEALIWDLIEIRFLATPRTSTTHRWDLVTSEAWNLVVFQQVGSDSLQKFYVVVGMKHRHLLVWSLIWLIDVHFSVHLIAYDQLMGHLDSKWLHGMILSIIEGPNFWIVEICHSFMRHLSFLLKLKKNK